MVVVNRKEIAKFRKQAKLAYPNEFCAFLIGYNNKENVFIDKFYIPKNQEEFATPDHIDIPSDWWEEAEDFADDNMMIVVGFIHTHPDFSDTALSEHDTTLFTYFREFIKNPIMGIMGIWSEKDKLKTRVSFWPEYRKHNLLVK